MKVPIVPHKGAGMAEIPFELQAAHARKSEGAGRAPVNIALVKYWGKRDALLNLPLTDSISISLSLYTTTSVALKDGDDEVCLNDAPITREHAFARRVSTYLDLFHKGGSRPGYRVQTTNEMPTAAGLASSASGFAALAFALDDLYGWGLSPRELSILARLGSGSAARSVCKGFVRWHAGECEDGWDSFAKPLGLNWPELRAGLLVTNDSAKAVDSRSGMRHVQETSPLFAAWPACVRRDLDLLTEAIRIRDFTGFGEVTEANAMAMHALCDSARPALSYLNTQSRKLLEEVRDLRRQGIPVYATMDAGPNLKLFYLAADAAAVAERFPSVREALPCF